MQIKRFEAGTMAEALKQVKREFGPEAVILSARTRKPAGGLLAPLRKPVVEVTAAMDRRDGQAPEAVPLRLRFAGKGALSHGSGAIHAVQQGEKTVYEGRTDQRRYDGEQRLAEAGPRLDVAHGLRTAGMDERLLQEVVREMRCCVDSGAQGDESALVTALADLLAQRQLCVATPAIGRGRRQIWAVVGPHGVGKTTTLVKLAALYRQSADGRVGLLTLDNRRIGAAEQLQTFGRILGLPFAAAGTPDEIAKALDRMAQVDLLLVDTPAAGPFAAEAIRQTGELLQCLPEVRIHLLFSAATRDGDVRTLLDGYRGLPLSGLIVTRIDETRRPGAMLNHAFESGLPIAYLSRGPIVPDDLSPASPLLLAQIATSALALAKPSPPVASAAGRSTPAGPVPDGNSQAYVANEHSDIFHRSDCKWTRNIKPAHKVFFASPAEGRAKHFKPCRTCAPESLRMETATPSRQLAGEADVKRVIFGR